MKILQLTGISQLRIGIGGELLWIRWWTLGFLSHELVTGKNSLISKNITMANLFIIYLYFI
jgi:hypothetical protein